MVTFTSYVIIYFRLRPIVKIVAQAYNLSWIISKVNSVLMKLPLPGRTPVASFAVSPDGKWLAVGQAASHGEYSLSIWNTKTWKCTAKVRGGTVYTLSFNRHSDTLAFTCSDHMVRIFDMKRKKLSHVLFAETARNAVFARHKDLLLICGKVTTVLDTPDIFGSWGAGDVLGSIEDMLLEVGHALTPPKKQKKPMFVYDKYRAFGTSHKLHPSLFKDYYRVSKAVINRGGYSTAPAGAVFCNQDNDLLITGNNDNKFSLYDLNTGKLKAKYPGGLIQIDHIMTDPAEEFVFVIADLPKTNLLFKLPAMERAWPQTLHDKRVGARVACVHPSGRYIATSNSLSTVGLIDLQTGELNEEAINTSDYTSVMIFSNDGKFLIIGGVDAHVIDVTKYIG